MTSFVKIPTALLDDFRLTPRALALWIHIRRTTWENLTRLCFQSAATIDQAIRHAPEKGDPRNLSSAFKHAQRELRDAGYLVAKARPGWSSLRWAISPGADGELELRELVRRGYITAGQLEDTLRRQRRPGGSLRADSARGRDAFDPQGRALATHETEDNAQGGKAGKANQGAMTNRSLETSISGSPESTWRQDSQRADRFVRRERVSGSCTEEPSAADERSTAGDFGESVPNEDLPCR